MDKFKMPQHIPSEYVKDVDETCKVMRRHIDEKGDGYVQ